MRHDQRKRLLGTQDPRAQAKSKHQSTVSQNTSSGFLSPAAAAAAVLILLAVAAALTGMLLQ